MAQALQIVDALGTVLFDLNGVNGVDAGSVTVTLYQPLDLGVGTPAYERRDHSNADGGSTIGGRRGLVPFTIPFRLQGATYDARVLGMSRLAVLLAAGCTIKWTAEGSVNTRYIDVEPSPTPALIDGREMALWDATRLLDNPEPIVLSLVRQPDFRGLELDPRVNILTNSTLLRDTPVDGTPDFWSWSSVSNITNQTIIATSDDLAAFQFDIATAAQRQLLQQTAVGTVADLETWTMSGYARVTSGSFTNCECQAQIEFQNSGGTTVDTINGTLIPLTTTWQRISVTGTASDATTSRAQAGLRMDNTSATSATVQFKFVQFEEAASASTFRVGTETLSNDPAVAPGRLAFFYNAGELRTPVRGYYAASGSLDSAIVAVRGSTSVAFANYAYKQCESMTQGTNTATATEGAAASGTGSDVSETTFGTNDLTVPRLTWTLSASELAGVIGSRLQLWVRAVGVASPLTVNLQADISFGGTAYRIPYVAAAAPSSYSDIYIGTFTVPDDASTVVIRFYAERVTGAVPLRWDFAHLVPTDSNGIYSGGGAFTLLETDPTIPRVAAVSSLAGAVTAIGSSAGPVAFIASPGLNAVYVVRATDAISAWQNNTLQAHDVSFFYSPHYPL